MIVWAGNVPICSKVKSQSSVECSPRGPFWLLFGSASRPELHATDLEGSRITNDYRCLHRPCWTQVFPPCDLLVREFTIANIEHYIALENKDHDKFNGVCNVEIVLLDLWVDLHIQEASRSKKKRTKARDAVNRGITVNQPLGYQEISTQVGHQLSTFAFGHIERAHCTIDCWDAETWAVLDAPAMQIVLPMVVKHYKIITEKEAVECNSLGRPCRILASLMRTVESLNKATLVKNRLREVTSGSRWSRSARSPPITMIITKPGYITEKHWKSWLVCCRRLQDLTWIALQAQVNSGKHSVGHVLLVCHHMREFYHWKCPKQDYWHGCR